MEIAYTVFAFIFGLVFGWKNVMENMQVYLTVSSSAQRRSQSLSRKYF